jgi:hypothetical protein
VHVCGESIVGSKIVMDTPDRISVTWVLWNLVSICLETALVSVQDMCTVCAKCNIGSKIALDPPDGSPRFEAQLEACFGLFGDSANHDAR